MINIRNPKEYCENYLYIRDKKQRLVKLKFKPAQENLYRIIKEEHQAGRPVRLIVLKGRQEGISTATEAVMFQDSATRPMVNTLIVAHQDKATSALFRMNKLFYDCLPKALQPMRKNSNAKELVFENPTRNEDEKRRRPGLRSRISCVTAGGKGVGRSETFNNVHLSELAFWTGEVKETLLGIMQAVPDDPDTMVIIESTANGFNEFKDLWDGAVAGTNGWRPVFLPWYMEPEYRKPVESDAVWTDEELRLKETYHLDEEQLSWRRWCIKTNCGGDAQIFRQEYPATPDEAFIATGRCVFDKDALTLRREQVRKLRPERGRFAYTYDDRRTQGDKITDIRWEPDERGEIRILHRPEAGVPYVLGGDTAGDGSDCFAGQVLDNRTGAQAAVLQQQLDETEYTRQMYCLGMYYNTALMGIEINYSTYPQKEMQRLGYPKFYVRERVDTYTGAVMQTYGFETNSRTRPLMIDGLKAVAREAPELIGDYETLGEMLTFVYDERRRPQAEVGKHDDLVMALAIAHCIRPQQRYTAKLPAGKRVQWTRTMWEDYDNATAEQKIYLRRKWGEPEE